MNIVPYFQPIVDISTAQVAGHEVLARIIDDTGRARSAGHLFTDASMDEASILAIDRNVRAQAMQRFAEAGQPGFLTLNISPRWVELLAGSVVPTIEMMREYRIAPEKLVVEITETHSDSAKLMQIASLYKQEGIRVAVDDFGSGYAHFDRVISLEPDIVKLDMRLFKEAVRGGFPQHIVHSLSFMAERLGSMVLCEGIEDFAELSFALEIGSRLHQGFMFSAAQPHFSDRHAFSRDIAGLRYEFLQQRIARERRQHIDEANLLVEAEKLCQLIRDAGEKFSPEQITIADERAFRLFLCDTAGTQISPNFHLQQGRWLQNYDRLGTNWSWRPYFYQLFSAQMAGVKKPVASREYHDSTTGMLIKTIACFVDAQRILMVDVRDTGSFSL